MLFISESPLSPFIFDFTPILGKKVGPSLFKNLCQYNSNMADVVALVAPSDAILSPLFHMPFLFRSA